MKHFLFRGLLEAERGIFDRFEFKVPSLRISLKSACNENCFYCHNEGVPAGIEETIGVGDIVNTIYLLKNFGLKKVKLTGGEPLLFKDLRNLLLEIKHIADVDIYITTNGTLIKKRIKDLNPNIVDKISVSLDTLSPKKYRLITGKNFLKEVLSGIEMLKSEGFNIEINCLLLRGINSNPNDLNEIVSYCVKNCFDLQFIELSDTTNDSVYNTYYEDPIAALKKIGFDFTEEKHNDRKFFKVHKSKITFCKSVKDLCDSTEGRCSGLRLLPDGRLKDFFYN